MRRNLQLVSEIALCLAGVVVVRNMAGQRRTRTAENDASAAPLDLSALQRAANDLEIRFQEHESLTAKRFAEVEARLVEHDTRLAQLPRTEDIVAAMEQLLGKTMTQIEDRLAGQARCIQLLKVTASQTDDLLNRVLENVRDTLASRPGVREE